MSYDVTAKVINDGINAYAYDAEGRLCAISNSYAGTATGYLYDAGGNRVAKGTITTLSCDIASGGNGFQMTNEFLLGPTGNQVTEINNTNTGSWAWAHSNVWAGTNLDATVDWMQNTQNSQWNAAVHFQLSDPLGSRRVQTGAEGGWQAQFGTLPFGDQFQEFINTANQFADDATEHHFTNKEYDQESTNNFYFGARYYSSSMGRFLSPDPKMASGHATNPQSWNRYNYSLNNPLKFFDADGKEAILFYRPPDPGKSSLEDFGHVFIYVRNEKTGRSGVFDFYPDAGKSAIHRSVDATRRDAHAGLSIPTTPEQADKMLDKMDALTKANIPFTADTASKTDILTGNVNDCATTTESILGAGGIKDSSISPTGLWNDLSSDQNEDPSRLTGDPWDATDGTRTGDLGTGPATPIPGVILGDVGQPKPDLTQTGTPPPPPPKQQP